MLILFGANDIWSRSQDLRSSANAVLQMALRVRNFGAIPVIGTATPFINPREWYKPRVDTFNNYIRYYASAYGIALADLQKAFGTGYGLIISDGVHPNQTGSDIIARSFAARISLPPLILRPKTFSTPETGAQNLTVAATVSGSRTAVANVPWITITSGSSGSGNGTITFNVATNTGRARSGTITVNGGGISREVTINQSAATLETNPSTIFVPSSGRTAVTITVSAVLPWTASSATPWAQIASGSSGSGNGIIQFNVDANYEDVRVGAITVSVGETSRSISINQWPQPVNTGRAVENDFDGDGIADYAVFHPATGIWKIRFANGVEWAAPWGWSAVVPVPADYDGDRIADIAVYHPGGGGWYIMESLTGLSRVEQMGSANHVPVPGDYDGDGVADLATYHRPNGFWNFRTSSSGDYGLPWGWSAVVPVPGDYDGDARQDIAVYHPASGSWYILDLHTGTLMNDAVVGWGWSSVRPIPADYDGDGTHDIAVFYRPAATWYIRSSITGAMMGADPLKFGWSAVAPVSGDYDGDGQSDITVYHPASGNWYSDRTAQGLYQPQLGGPSYIPVTIQWTINNWYNLP